MNYIHLIIQILKLRKNEKSTPEKIHLLQWKITDNAVIDSEVHKVYGGNNAKAQIEIPVELLPPNVSVSVFQAGSVYVLHFVSYGEADALNNVDAIELLRQTDCIK